MRGYHLLLAITTGTMLSLAWPAVGGVTPLILVAWVPLLWAEERFANTARPERPRHFMPFVLLALLLWNLWTTWWLFEVSEPIGVRLFTLIGPNVGNVLVMALPWVLMRWARRRWGGPWARAVLCASWIAMERFHMNWDLSWPWLTLGNVFAGHPDWVQWYEWTGHLGGSWWTWGINLAAFELFRAARAGADVRSIRRKAALVGALFLVPFVGSLVRYHTFQEQGVPQEVVVVQPNIDPYTQKFGVDPLVQLDDMLRLAEPLLTPRTGLVVMPETALQEPYSLVNDHGRLVTSGLWEEQIDRSRSVRRIREFLGGRPRLSVLTGMSSGRLYGPEDVVPSTARRLGDSGASYDSFNAALLVRGDGTTETYHKSKLVPGVELVPFEPLLGRLDGLALDLGGTTGSLGVQDEREVLITNDGQVRAAPVICYESIYGDHVAAHVRNGASVIIIMTNDAWWGDSPGFRHHLAYGRLRAVETRRSIARSANTGISCFIDQRGDVHQATDWWTATAVRGELLARTDLTLFARTGDVIGLVAQGSTVLIILVLIFLRKRKP